MDASRQTRAGPGRSPPALVSRWSEGGRCSARCQFTCRSVAQAVDPRASLGERARGGIMSAPTDGQTRGAHGQSPALAGGPLAFHGCQEACASPSRGECAKIGRQGPPQVQAEDEAPQRASSRAGSPIDAREKTIATTGPSKRGGAPGLARIIERQGNPRSKRLDAPAAPAGPPFKLWATTRRRTGPRSPEIRARNNATLSPQKRRPWPGPAADGGPAYLTHSPRVNLQRHTSSTCAGQSPARQSSGDPLEGREPRLQTLRVAMVKDYLAPARGSRPTGAPGGAVPHRQSLRVGTRLSRAGPGAGLVPRSLRPGLQSCPLVCCRLLISAHPADTSRGAGALPKAAGFTTCDK